MITLYLNTQPKRYFYIYLFFVLLLLSIAVYIFTDAKKAHIMPEIPFYFFLFGSILLSVAVILARFTVFQIDADDENIIFTSLHSSKLVKITEILSTEPFKFDSMLLTLLHFKSGTLILKWDYLIDFPDMMLEPFYSHIKKFNNNFKRKSYELF